MIPRAAIPIGNEEIVAAFRSLFEGVEAVRDKVTTFENDLASYLGSKKVFGLNSGRTALYTALQALNLKRGDEVIVPAYTCAIVVEVTLRLGLKPVLVDADPATYNIDPELLPQAVSSRTKAVIPVHLFGQPCEMERIAEMAAKYSLYIIEDVAQALGAEYKKAKMGTFGDLAIFSFGPGKSMTSGEGGALSINDEELVEKVTAIESKLPNPDFSWFVHCLKNIVPMKVFSNPHYYALIKRFLQESLKKADRAILENCQRLLGEDDQGHLSPTIALAKMPLLSAEVARIQLRKLDGFNQKRIRNAEVLTKLLDRSDNSIQLPRVSPDRKTTFTRYPIRMLKGSRDEVIRGLVERGIDAGTPYDYLTDLYRSLRAKAPNAATLANSLLTVPNHPLLKPSDTVKIAETLFNKLPRNRNTGTRQKSLR